MTHDEETTYRRRGVVTASVLTGDRSWTTTAGDVLRSRAGDWWVVGEDGTGRGVAADRFHSLYEPVGADRYRRRGTVRARRVTTPEQVETLEGPAVAGPGMWIVRDGDDRWPVPDDEFRRGYERVASDG